MTPLRWGVVGLGWAACDFVAPAIVQSAGSKLVACLGSSHQKGVTFAQRFGVERIHDSLESLLGDPGIDVVYIALPNTMHHAAVLAAARAKKHVLCEKPFAMSVAHAREMVGACHDAGIVCRVAHQIRLDAAITRAREIVRSGRLGRLAAISLERSSANPPRKSWRLEAAQSGVIFDVGVHLIDLIQWVSGQHFVEVSALTHPDRQLRKSDDTATVLGRLDGDCHALARATREVASAENNLIIEGSQATLITSALRFAKEHVVHVRDADGTIDERYEASAAHKLQILAFENEVQGQRSMLPSAEEGLQLTAVMEAVLQSIDQRRIVAVPRVSS